MMERRAFIKGALVAAAGAAFGVPTMAHAEGTDKDGIEMTEDVASSMAEQFAQSVLPEKALSVSNLAKFYDTTGQAIGYIIDYSFDGSPYGYVVFDNTDDSLVSEYSFGENVSSPYAQLVSMDITRNRSRTDNVIYKTGLFAYSVENDGGQLINSYGEAEQIEITGAKERQNTSTPDSNSWNDVFIPYRYDTYTMGEFGSIPSFYGLAETYVEQLTKKYACMVSALTIASLYYGATSWSEVASAYNRIWTLSGTTEYKKENGISYGETAIGKAGPTLVNYCREKGVALSYEDATKPSYNWFKTSINNNNVGIFHAGININGTRSGHSMIVEGYCTLVPNTGGNYINCLIVCDGWNDSARYVNINYAKYTDTSGTKYHK